MRAPVVVAQAELPTDMVCEVLKFLDHVHTLLKAKAVDAEIGSACAHLRLI
jgi:hypothetical protein